MSSIFLELAWSWARLGGLALLETLPSMSRESFLKLIILSSTHLISVCASLAAVAAIAPLADRLLLPGQSAYTASMIAFLAETRIWIQRSVVVQGGVSPSACIIRSPPSGVLRPGTDVRDPALLCMTILSYIYTCIHTYVGAFGCCALTRGNDGTLSRIMDFALAFVMHPFFSFSFEFLIHHICPLFFHHFTAPGSQRERYYSTVHRGRPRSNAHPTPTLWGR